MVANHPCAMTLRAFMLTSLLSTQWFVFEEFNVVTELKTAIIGKTAVSENERFPISSNDIDQSVVKAPSISSRSNFSETLEVLTNENETLSGTECLINKTTIADQDSLVCQNATVVSKNKSHDTNHLADNFTAVAANVTAASGIDNETSQIVETEPTTLQNVSLTGNNASISQQVEIPERANKTHSILRNQTTVTGLPKTKTLLDNYLAIEADPLAKIREIYDVYTKTMAIYSEIDQYSDKWLSHSTIFHLKFICVLFFAGLVSYCLHKVTSALFWKPVMNTTSRLHRALFARTASANDNSRVEEQSTAAGFLNVIKNNSPMKRILTFITKMLVVEPLMLVMRGILNLINFNAKQKKMKIFKDKVDGLSAKDAEILRLLLRDKLQRIKQDAELKTFSKAQQIQSTVE